MRYTILTILFLSVSMSSNAMLNTSIGKEETLKKFCSKVNKSFRNFHWRKIICNPKRWQYERLSVNGDPLLYQTFFQNPKSKVNTFIFCGIHGDELPSTYLCVHLVRDIIFDNPKKYANSNIIVAPLVNPDSFFFETPSRLNANGVDLNRNFPTKDWDELAHKLWTHRYKKSKRRYPGPKAASEIETQFLVDIIKRFNPSQIVSVHGPYGFWDYDYDHKQKDWNSVKKRAYKLGRMSRHFPVRDFRVFPGSLGNYAGNDLKIPTYTLELNSVDSRDAHYLWLRFKDSIGHVLTE